MKKIIVFESIHYCIKAETILKENNFLYEIISIPRYISSDCGVCIVLEDSFEQIQELLNLQGFSYKTYNEN
jgi:tRNA A22 N-methylase